jgi:lipopolysaccharide assembly outer membrane protein LptD (OstA)
MVRALLFSCVVCLLAPGIVRAQNAGAPPQDVTQLSTLLEQQTSWKFECSGNHCILNGDVELPLPGGQGKFFADQIELFGDKDLLVASGNVVFANAEGRLAAEKAEFDLKKQTGTFYTASGTMPLGAAADRQQFGSQPADVYFWG